jgi:hypothetical protein
MAIIALLPWLRLAQEEALFGFLFTPVGNEHGWPGFDTAWAHHLTRLLSSYVDMHGEPIDSAVIVQVASKTTPWDIPEERIDELNEACRLLTLLLMEQQRFFEHGCFHVNSAACRLIFQYTALGETGVAPYIRRRGSPVRIGGMSFNNVRFQQPLETSYNGVAPQIRQTFRTALESARSQRTQTWLSLKDSLPLFLLGHSDDQNMPDETSVFLSAAAFEVLVGSSGAKMMAEKLAEYWRPFTTLTLSDTKGRIDPDPKWASKQISWPLHQKWAKELYESRNSYIHRRRTASDFRANWTAYQHNVLAAFAYPALVKLLLREDGLYTLDDYEEGYCRAFDELLAYGFEPKHAHSLRWSEILTTHEQETALQRALEEARCETERESG